MKLYTTAANRGDLCAAEKVARHYYEKENYDEMTWWFWWALFHDNAAKARNTDICSKIKKNTIRKMSANYKNNVQNGVSDQRVIKYLRKKEFISQLLARKRASR